MPEFARRDWIAGAILWCYQDYKSRRYFWPGQEEGYLEHGLVDEDRQRKPSYRLERNDGTVTGRVAMDSLRARRTDGFQRGSHAQ